MAQVLIVDDDRVQLRLRAAIVRQAGWQVQTVVNIAEALAALQSPDAAIGLILTDHNLAGESGVDLVRRLRRAGSTLPVLVLSGMPGIEVEYAGLNATVRLKPCPPAELVQLVRTALRGANLP